MFRLNNGAEITVLKDVEAILIPYGTKTLLKQDDIIYIQQILGGMFTVETNDGQLLRIDGKDAESIGQPIPDDRKDVTLEYVKSKGLKEVVFEQLKTCFDPEIPVNIVDLGLIYECDVKNIKNKDDEYLVYIMMTLTAPGCGMGEILKSDVEKKVHDIPSVAEVMIDLVFDPPWESSLMSEAAKLTLGL